MNNRIAVSPARPTLLAIGFSVLLLVLAACAPGEEPFSSVVLFSVGEDIRVVTFGETDFTVEPGVTPTPEPTIDVPEIFGGDVHPSGEWAFLTSLAGQSDSDGVWGGARILRVALDADGPASVTEAFSLLDVTGITCADGSNGGEGDCAPTDLAFNAAGTRMYVNEDSWDTVLVFAVDTGTGDLTFLNETNNVWLQGIAVHPTASYLYNGVNTYEIAGADLIGTNLFEDGGNGTLVADVDGDLVLFTTIYDTDNNLMAAYDLADPSAPSLLDAIDLGPKGAVFFALSDDTTQLVVVGNDTLTSLSFDGASFTQRDQITYADADVRVYRGAAWAEGTASVVATWFVQSQEQGGQTILEVAADGALSVLDERTTTGASRFALALP